ncbi:MULTISPECIES: hypothetical protein [unclassified Hahella]|uniref:type III secretion apparatus assembly protein SctX n=1 Tax=unclassified Hahella TaxID=2624107 RepID=UPI000FDF2822|nr:MULTISPECIES: hypothetical protein [unclassified Hahella]AZZ91044.1 hypothetical protein ENC22_07485 [Hahella sp. KA22]MBU6949805.1 hypothetical protein [Hahella sp. HN01]MDG9668404.1 hypothetical protein [Hahella sp. CR1]QAY54414.1 hypothetical protein EUZ85_10040 [Hahella sp. KA22]
MTNISLRSNIEGLSLYNAADERQLPSHKKFTPAGGQVVSHLRQLYSKGEESSLLDSFIRPRVSSESLLSPVDFERQYGEVRGLFQKLAQQSPEDRELFSKAEKILRDNQDDIRYLNQYRNALIEA